MLPGCGTAVGGSAAGTGVSVAGGGGSGVGISVAVAGAAAATLSGVGVLVGVAVGNSLGEPQPERLTIKSVKVRSVKKRFWKICWCRKVC